MLLKAIALSFVLLNLVSARNQLTNCLDDDKYCVGLPRGCLGQECFVAFSSISNGTHSEIEIFGNDMLDKTWLAVAYSADKEMKDDFVVFCIRDDKLPNNRKILAGLAYNTDHNNEMIGTIKEIQEDPSKDSHGLKLAISDYEKEDKTLYCKMTIRVDPIIEHFKTSKVEMLMSKGVWINNKITYHGKTRNFVGQIDLSGAKKKKKNSASTSIALLSSAVTFIATKFIFF